MKVSKVRIQEFKRFKDLTIDLGDSPKKIVAIVGPNGCGKSSVLDAFIALGPSFGARIGTDPSGSVKNYFFRSNNKNFYELIDIDFVVGGIVYRKDELRNIEKYKNSLNSLFSFRSPYRYNNDLNIKEIRAVSPIEENRYSASYSVSIDEKIEENYRGLLAYFNSYRDDNDLKPSEARKHVIDQLNNSIKNCLDLEIVSMGEVEGGNGTLFFKKPDSDVKFSFNSLSSGEKEVVDILLDLFLRKEKYKGSIYLIDEPELHINTCIQRNLMKEINNLIDDEGQIWITTHSIGFLRALQTDFIGDSQIIKFHKNINLSDKIELKPIDKNYNEWKEIFETALDDLTGLIAPKRIIYCEGRAELKDSYEKGLDAKVLNNIFNKKYPDTLFVSSGGNTELDYRSRIAIAILGKVFKDLEIWVFKDRDIASGGNVSEFDRQEYLDGQENSFRVMKRWEIENYLFDKEILKAYCDKKGCQFDESRYDAVVTDVVNNNVKDKGGEIKKCCGITTPINIEIFKENLSNFILPDTLVYKELEDCIFNRK
ncbi:AAA family ATPase [Campylobacter concisus]|uniref:AAA family ATPase n=1 Tax=Campylobacter concisus TaxID=199 RepID=UPI000CD8F641|nr:ATP-binding protein [Campylobacter concisus]